MSKKRISVPQPGAQEQGYMQRAQDLLQEGRAGLEQGAYAQNLLAPYQYNLAGLDVNYEDRSGRMGELQAQHDKLASQLTTLQQAKGKKAKKAALAELRQSNAAGELNVSGKKITAKKLKKYLKKSLAGSEKEIGDTANAPLRIKSIKENADAAATRAREEGLYKNEQDLLQKSLSMNNEDVLNADPALKRQLAEEQAKLEQQQVQQFGGLANSQGGTIGAVQNAAEGQRRAEAISNARRENIGLYAGLQTQQGAFNTQKRAAQQGLAAQPSAAQQASGMNFGNLASGYGGLLAQQAGIRQQQFQANSFNQTQPSIGESILKGVGGLLQPFKNQS